MTKNQTENGSRVALMVTPAYLVAIARAAHLAGDTELSRVSQAELRQRFGIRIAFDAEAKLTTGSRLLAKLEGTTNG